MLEFKFVARFISSLSCLQLTLWADSDLINSKGGAVVQRIPVEQVDEIFRKLFERSATDVTELLEVANKINGASIDIRHMGTLGDESADSTQLIAEIRSRRSQQSSTAGRPLSARAHRCKALSGVREVPARPPEFMQFREVDLTGDFDSLTTGTALAAAAWLVKNSRPEVQK